MTKKEKEFCVHIHHRPYEYENIIAESPEKAELYALEVHNGGNYDDIGNIEVMQVCHCDEDTATDNDITNITCDNCGKTL